MGGRGQGPPRERATAQPSLFSVHASNSEHLVLPSVVSYLLAPLSRNFRDRVCRRKGTAARIITRRGEN